MNVYRLFFIAAIITFLSACTTTNYAQQASGLSLDMNKAEVLQVMGPANKNAVRKSDDQVMEEWSYWTPKRIGLTVINSALLADDNVTVFFVDGRVSEWGDAMNYNRILEKSLESQQKIMSNITYPDVKMTIEDNRAK